LVSLTGVYRRLGVSVRVFGKRAGELGNEVGGALLTPGGITQSL
jgi:hypothetical protein